MHKPVIWLTVATVATVGVVLMTPIAAKGKKTTVGSSVAGIRAPYSAAHPWPGDKAPISEITKQPPEDFSVILAGSGWTDMNRTQISIVWQASDAVSCTGSLANLKVKVLGTIDINAASISGSVWDDWLLTRPGYLTFDSTKWEEAVDLGGIGCLSWIIIHEFTCIFDVDWDSNPKYWTEFQGSATKWEVFSSYAGRNNLGTLPGVVGYRVAHCAKDDPYDTGRFNVYYEWVKTDIFAGRKFGPVPGTKTSCDMTQDQISTPIPDWVKASSSD